MASPETPPPTPQQLKKALVEAGFEIFRTRGDEVLLAERPRENLIMDSGVRLRAGRPLEVRVVLRAQKADYPNEDETHLFDRVAALAMPALSAGFVESERSVQRVPDPGDRERTLDTFYEISYRRPAESLDAAVLGLRFALGLEKRA